MSVRAKESPIFLSAQAHTFNPVPQRQRQVDLPVLRTAREGYTEKPCLDKQRRRRKRKRRRKKKRTFLRTLVPQPCGPEDPVFGCSAPERLSL